jgi:ankyrin repeat protein/ribosomal protein S18 acetylase RimI-like enzyme
MDVRRIDLERARREAKALLAAARAGEPEARARMAAVPGELKLSTAQLALARELGERSWPALVRRAELESATTRERAGAFVRAATSDRIDHADVLLARDAAIPRTLPAAALVLGEPVSVDPLVSLEPLGWLPLVYVTHSRYLGGERTDALVASAERLLEAGADPNGAYTHEEFGEQSALYGAAGIAHEPRLTRLLLDHGANPDDHESLYHATESRDLTCVRLLLEAGASVAGTNALAHALDREDGALVELLLEHGPPAGERWAERDRAIPWAIYRNRSARIVRLLAERGADLEARDDRTRRTPYALAVARGRTDLGELLEELGATPVASNVDRLIGACMRGDRDDALARAAGDPSLVAGAGRDLGAALIIAAGEGRVEATALLVDIGAPIEARGEMGGGPLHHAAWNGRGGTVDLLLRRGADPVAISGPPTNSTPIAWAAHGSRYAGVHGDAHYGIGRRLVHEGGVRDPELADVATGQLSDWLAGRGDEPAPEPAPGGVDYGELYWRTDVEGLRLLAALPGAESRPAGDGFAVRTGVLDNTQNGVVCDACGDGELAEVIAWLAGRPAQWYVSGRDSLHEQLLAAGAMAETSSVVMGGPAADLDLAPRGGAHDVRAVESEPELDAWLGVAEDWGLIDGPRERARRRAVLLGLALPRPAPVLLQIAWEGDLAVGAIAARRHDEVLVIEHLGVRSGSQRRGVGRALIAAAVGAEPGAVEVVLGPTPSSIAFYERLGFVLQRFPPNRSFYLPATADESE